MCGITGKLFFQNGRPVSPQLIQRMTNTLIHRGPDDAGYYIDGNFGFGMRRLSIIDLAGGHQPIFNEDKSLAIIFNGEIYNYRELKKDLENRGHRFRTNSDTETILHCYEQYGNEFMHKLNGMFAIAIWDIKNHKLLLVRDRLGIKPLYYYLDNEKLLFGSEIKAIIEDETIGRKVNPDALDMYLSFMYVPNPLSMFEKIYKLPPGHLLVCENGKTEVRRYWDINFAPDHSRTEKEFIEEYNHLLEDAVKIRLLSEVPLGAFLSGGVDSSSIVAMMAKVSSHRVKTFSIGFEEGGYHDETKYAELIAKKFGTEHTSFKVSSSMLQMLPKYVYHFDEPFADYAAFPTYVVSKLARQHVTVVLTGDGGDEIFAGYDRYRFEALADKITQLPSGIRNGMLLPLSRWLKNLASAEKSSYAILNGIYRRLHEMNKETGRRYIERFYLYDYPDKSRLMMHPGIFKNDFAYTGLKDIWKNNFSDNLARRLYFDIMTSLPEDMLTKVDRVTMAVSLEARVPLLDYRIVELSARIPSHMKMSLRKLKRFMKHAAAGYLPQSIINRPKHGFSSPIDRWLRHDLKEMTGDILSPENVRRSNYFEPQFVSAMVNDHFAGKANYGEKLFMLMVFLMWHSVFMKPPHSVATVSR